MTFTLSCKTLLSVFRRQRHAVPWICLFLHVDGHLVLYINFAFDLGSDTCKCIGCCWNPVLSLWLTSSYWSTCITIFLSASFFFYSPSYFFITYVFVCVYLYCLVRFLWLTRFDLICSLLIMRIIRSYFISALNLFSSCSFIVLFRPWVSTLDFQVPLLYCFGFLHVIMSLLIKNSSSHVSVDTR